MPGKRRVPRHPQNVDGPFYVVRGECMSCGAPEMGAPNLMSHDSRGHCFFARQPASPEETNQAIEAASASCCGALRYGGTNTETLIRLAEMGMAEQCDFRLKKDEPRPCPRTCVSFEFVSEAKTAAERAKEIARYLADSLKKTAISDGNLRSLCFTGVSASFVYEWGYVLGTPCRARFAIEPHVDLRRWWVLTTREDGHTTTSFAIFIHKALIADRRFQSIQWFSADERKISANIGHRFPY